MPWNLIGAKKTQDLEIKKDGNKNLEDPIVALETSLGAVIKELAVLSMKSRDFESRLQDLELWRVKLHAMITEKSRTGKERLNVIGRKFIRP